MSKQSPIAVVLGTRPEIIKLAPVIGQLGRGVRVVHTGQHYSEPMSDQVSADLALPAVAVNLGLGGTDRGAQLGSMISALTREFGAARPAAVIVQGDTTSALAGALAANANDIPLCHVEAGLRSFDRAMPEEHNRVLIDHLADLCCAPTQANGANLTAENIPPERIQVTGNTIIDALQYVRPPSTVATDTALRQLGLTRDRFVLATLHRPENVDRPGVLELLLKQLNALPLPVLLPLHPRTEQRVVEFGLVALLGGMRVTGPLRYPDFLALAGAAAVLVSDSGGLQEEASVLKRPIVVLRRSTERPEVEGTFGIRVDPGPDSEQVLREWTRSVDRRLRRLSTIPSPFGDGESGKRIAAAIQAMI
ncbi:MAG: UDP-N-acetylglucosamine 2-epimerase (non-hydrolyzing) [Kibdelosporangium sp.]